MFSNLGELALSLVRGYLNRLDLPPEAFDVIVAKSSLHHVVDLDGLMRAVGRGLARGAENAKQCMGFEDTQNGTDLAVERTAPFALFLTGLTVLHFLGTLN